MTKSLVITPTGLIVNNEQLIPLQYSINADPSGAKPYIIAMCKSPQDHFPQDLFPRSIAPLPGSRHYRGERISISPAHPLYRYFRWAAYFIKYQLAMVIWWWLDKQDDQDPLNADFFQKRKQSLWSNLKHVFWLSDCGQPTANDIEITRKWNSTHSSPGDNFYTSPDQLTLREHRQRLMQDGTLVINQLSDQYPIQPDAPYVVIEGSEYPAFSSWQSGSLALSVSAADAVLRHYDSVAFEDGDFCVVNLAIYYNENGAPKVQRITLHLGGQNGSLIEYLQAQGDWLFVKNSKEPDNVVLGIDLIILADLLSKYIEPAIIKVEYAPWLQDLLALADQSEQEAAEFDLSDAEIRDCVLSLPHDDESTPIAEALIDILSERDDKKAMELYEEWTDSND